MEIKNQTKTNERKELVETRFIFKEMKGGDD